jgi:hypothetical protein
VKILGPVFQQLVEGEQPHGNKLPKRDLTLPLKPGRRRRRISATSSATSMKPSASE